SCLYYAGRASTFRNALLISRTSWDVTVLVQSCMFAKSVRWCVHGKQSLQADQRSVECCSYLTVGQHFGGTADGPRSDESQRIRTTIGRTENKMHQRRRGLC